MRLGDSETAPHGIKLPRVPLGEPERAEVGSEAGRDETRKGERDHRVLREPAPVHACVRAEGAEGIGVGRKRKGERSAGLPGAGLLSLPRTLRYLIRWVQRDGERRGARCVVVGGGREKERFGGSLFLLAIGRVM